MFNSGRTRCGQSAGRWTWTHKLSIPVVLLDLVELGQANGQPAALPRPDRELLPLGVGLGHQRRQARIVVEQDVDLGGHRVMDVQDDAQAGRPSPRAAASWSTVGFLVSM